MVGQTLAHFKITAKLGEGGMGEVYRAEDSKLGREVAIKVLPEQIAQDPGRLTRFQREAKVLASLNHNHIASIHQAEQDGDTHFLVMELVEGLDLKERLARGPIELDEALSTALQIAQALEAAHEKGVVHRDLKPANVKVTPEGQVKVLDFGLAKALDVSEASPGAADASPVALSMSPTLTAGMTQAGVILGTAAYMSPEQARGKPVDRRADVWAFGVLLWEMLTAETLFDGETVTDVIASVVTQELDLDALPDTTPPEVVRLLGRCLRKDPSLRFPDIGAARVVLQDVLAGTTPEPRAAAAGGSGHQAELGQRSRGRWALGAATLIAVGLVAGAILLRPSGQVGPQQTVHFGTELPEGWSLGTGSDRPVPSPDGDRVLFRAVRHREGGETEASLWIRSLESLNSLPVGGTEGVGGYGPIAWSPDGGSILFRVDDEARILDLGNGTVRTIAKIHETIWSQASWNEDGTLLFTGQGTNGPVIHSLPASAGAASPLTSLDPSRQEQGHWDPQFLPDGNHFLFMVYAGEGSENTGLFLASLDDLARRQKVSESSDWIRWHYSAGHLLSVQQGALLAQPFDPRQGRTTGAPVTIAPSVDSAPGFPMLGRFSTSPAGTMAYLPGSGTSGARLAWRNREGEVMETFGESGNYGQLALSPDGRYVALEIPDDEGRYDLWVMDVVRGVTSRVTATPDNERDPVWSPDGRSLIYLKRGGEETSLCRKGLRTSDAETVLIQAAEEYIPESWSADGKTIMVVQRNVEDQQSVYALTEGEEPRPFLTPGFRVDEPQISPDGKWLAYVSPESDQPEVYLEPLQQDGERVRVSLDGGGQPKWSASSQELFFINAEHVLMVATVGGGDDGGEVGLPQELFGIDWVEGPGYDDYAVSADGERFLVKERVGQSDIELQVVTNWTGLLE